MYILEQLSLSTNSDIEVGKRGWFHSTSDEGLFDTSYTLTLLLPEISFTHTLHFNSYNQPRYLGWKGGQGDY